MGLLPSLKISFEKPNLGIAPEVKNLLKKPPKKKDEPLRYWSLKERLFVGAILIGTLILSLYFWYQGQGSLPNVSLPQMGSFSFGEEKIILEK